jgi:protease I
VRQFASTGRPVAAICHGSWTLLETGALKGKTVTSWPSLKTDLKNAGANWIDQEVVTDGQFIFSRKPDDIPAFNKAIIAAVGQGGKQSAAA